MTPVTPSQVSCKVSIVSTSILIRQTLLLTSTTLLVIRVLHLMTQVCSIAHMYLCRWYVPLVRTASSPRLALRPVMVLLPTHSQKVWIRVWVDSVLTATATTEESPLRISCDSSLTGRFSESPSGLSFFMPINI